MPNLNMRTFLPERFETIFNQSCQDWELLVYDSYSNDGSWEYIRDVAASDSRIRAWQGPPEGAIGSWTPCVRQARGEYVYIATSDDTMAPDCLEKLVAALDGYPECDLAHCRLHPIDEQGGTHSAVSDWWRHHSAFALSSGRLIDVPHLRKAPLDGLLHLLGGVVYASITQLLIRRALFDRIGYFEGKWGSLGDFNWGMRAGLLASTVHVPGTWGGWRVHARQATAGVRFSSPEHAKKIDHMIEDAIEACAPLLAPDLRWRLPGLSVEVNDLRTFMREMAALSSGPAWRRGALLVRRLLRGSPSARQYLRGRLQGNSSVDWVRQGLQRVVDSSPLVPLSAAGCSRRTSHAPSAAWGRLDQ